MSPVTEVFQEAFKDVESSIQNIRAKIRVSVYYDQYIVILQVLHQIEAQMRSIQPWFEVVPLM